jgi:hypothetical protein
MYMKNKEVISIMAQKTMKEPISPLSLRKYTGLVVFGKEGPRSDLDHPQPEDGGLLRPQSSYFSLRLRALEVRGILSYRRNHLFGRT